MSELQWHVRNPGPCGACGKDCADRVTIQEANVDPGHYCDTCAQVEFLNRSAPQFRTVGCDSPGPAVFYSCAQCDAAMDADAARASLFCSGCKAKPPTLREWLGDRVSELGPWAEVLREQPVSAGQIVGWEWYQTEMLPRLWMLRAQERAWEQVFGPSDTVDFLTRWEDFEGDCLRESLQMALCTRHPAVKPEPRNATLRTWFGNEEEP